MSDWMKIMDRLPEPGQPIEARIAYRGQLATVFGVYSQTEWGVVTFPFYSGAGAEVIVEWRPRALTMGDAVPPVRNETPESITKWAEATFGPTHPGPIARRMLVEVKELIEAFDLSEDLPVDRLGKRTVAHLREEVADISIMLDQVGHLLGGDVQKAKNAKMRVNRERRWAYDPALGRVQHVTKFKEESTGLDLDIGRWYLMERAGGRCVYPAGFDSAKDALAHASATRAGGAWGQVSVGVVVLDPKDNEWVPNEAYTFVVVSGRDLYDHQTPPTGNLHAQTNKDKT